MHLISISEAARLADTSRQNIDNKKQFPDRWGFLLNGPDGWFVDPDHPDWFKFVEMVKAGKRQKAGLPKDPEHNFKDPGSVDRFSLFVSAVESVCVRNGLSFDILTEIQNEYDCTIEKISGE